MDTFVEISCYSKDKSSTRKAIKEAFEEIERIAKIFNKYDEKSELSKVNKLAWQEEIKISKELFDLIKRSIYYSELSGGSFDITLISLGYQSVVLNEEDLSIRFLNDQSGNFLSTSPTGHLSLDLGGIVKGYAVDKAKDILLSKGIERALINIGGNIYASGNPPGKKAWKIGIQHPRDKNKIIKKIDLRDEAVSTSGDYERPLHIINPITGLPAKEVASVTVIASTAEEADALSTAVFVMGEEKGKALIESLGGVEVFVYP